MTKTVKRLSVIIFAALAGLCAFFALLSSRPVMRAKAETIITVTVYDGNSLTKIDSAGLNTTVTPQKFPEKLTDSVHAYFGADESNIYGVQAFMDTAQSENANVWATFDTLKKTSFFGSKNIDIYVYIKSNVKIKLFEGSTEKGALTVPYTKKIKDVTLDELNAVPGVPKSGYVLKGFTPNGTNSTFPMSGVRSLSLEYGKETAVVFKNEDGSKILCTKHLAAGSIYDTRYDNEIQTAAIKEGFLLKGWRGTLDSDLVINKIPISDNDMILYAVYEENISNTVTITFKDGETVLYTAEIQTGDALTLADYPELEKKSQKAGYIFKGWQSEGGTLIEAGSLHLLKAYKDTTYTAVYEEDDPDNYYMVEFLVGKKRIGLYLVKKGEDMIFADYPKVVAAQEKEGYNFKGWKLYNKVYSDKLPAQSEDVQLDAVFEEKSFFEKNFGIGISTGGLIVIVLAVYLLFSGRRRR